MVRFARNRTDGLDSLTSIGSVPDDFTIIVVSEATSTSGFGEAIVRLGALDEGPDNPHIILRAARLDAGPAYSFGERFATETQYAITAVPVVNAPGSTGPGVVAVGRRSRLNYACGRTKAERSLSVELTLGRR